MLPVTSSVAAFAAVCLVALSISVSFQRMKAGVAIGMGDDLALLRRIRAQGNFTEYVPLALILLALAEYRGAPVVWLLAIAGLLVVGRLLHFVGILSGRTAIRAPGMLGTYGSLVAGAAAVLFG